jgi:hypothetical protein
MRLLSKGLVLSTVSVIGAGAWRFEVIVDPTYDGLDISMCPSNQTINLW